ncbi:Arabinanase/levansucrase/invertase [Morchella conica CCBAS932]|uniref:Arabinanase/levansucrase/invertase n=1 Tax=Morchella conica CCBAS932 TaxID=1392247 RepID=A0A3N4KDI5_9PEZI|nr:Arabinanase/levansucrase/invertase [Morchella conica CCBAS932]
MKYSFALASLLAGAASAQNLSTANLADVDITTAGNNTLFTRWRPTSHFMGPHSWLNDPCAPSYDPATGLYHLMYQWNPHHINWGNISWGHAVSKDMVTWTDVRGWEDDKAQGLGTGPKGTLDHLGVFSGSAQFLPANQSYGLPGLNFTSGPTDKTIMAIFYTSVQHLPTNWKLPYINSTETQTLAVSVDGGMTFTKFEGEGVNPVIPQPPPNLNITGFRDPIYEKWSEMDDILFGNASLGNFYTVLGSGIKGAGGRLPFYYAPADDLTDWRYLGPIFARSENESWSEVYSGSFGYNFEVAGAFSLTESDEHGGDSETAHHFVIMGTEGGETTKHPSPQWALWTEVAITRSNNGSAHSEVLSSGVLDWGLSYAWNSFWDAPNKRRIAWGWAKEEDLTVAKTAQGWQGVMTLPRQLYVKVYSGLKNTAGVLTTKGSWTSERKADGTWDIKTMGMLPAPEVVESLREGATRASVNATNAAPNTYKAITSNLSANIHAEITIPQNTTTPVGFSVLRSPDGEEETLIVYDPAAKEIRVIREGSSSLNSSYVNTYPNVAPLFLLDYSNGKREKLVLDIFVDNSMIEVFANERVGITSRVYPARVDSTGLGMWTGEGQGEVTFSKVKIWTGLKNAFPERPANSSNALVWDSPEETGNYTWWPGN